MIAYHLINSLTGVGPLSSPNPFLFSMIEVKEKQRFVEKAYLLAVISKEEERANAESLLDELDELVFNLGIKIFHKKVVRVRKTYPGYLIGKGKFNEIIEEVSELGRGRQYDEDDGDYDDEDDDDDDEDLRDVVGDESDMAPSPPKLKLSTF